MVHFVHRTAAIADSSAITSKPPANYDIFTLFLAQ